jgi:hypothetical protein
LVLYFAASTKGMAYWRQTIIQDRLVMRDMQEGTYPAGCCDVHLARRQARYLNTKTSLKTIILL